MKIEETACTICGAIQKEENFTFETPDYWYGVGDVFRLYRCHQCQVIYQFPYPTQAEIDSYYPAEYTPYFEAIEDETSVFTQLNRRYALNKQLRLIKRLTGGKIGSALDVGCATGILLDGLRQHGWDVAGIEMNDDAAQYGRDRFGLDIRTGTLESTNLPDGQFDLVMMWNVLEHVTDPIGALEQLNRLTRPGGHLILNLPDPESIEAGLFKKYWGGWDQPRHLFIFPTELAKRLLADTGWTFEEKISYGGRFFLFRLSLFHRINDRVQNKNLARLLKAIIGSPIAKVITLPWFILTDGIKRGSVMVLVAKKDG